MEEVEGSLCHRSSLVYCRMQHGACKSRRRLIWSKQPTINYILLKKLILDGVFVKHVLYLYFTTVYV